MNRALWVLVDLIGRIGCAVMLSAILWPLTGHQMNHGLAIGITGGVVMAVAIVTSSLFENRGRR